MDVDGAPEEAFDWILEGFDVPDNARDKAKYNSLMTKLQKTPDATFVVAHQSGFKSTWTASVVWKQHSVVTRLYSQLKGHIEAVFPPGARYNLKIWVGNRTSPTVLRENKALEIILPSTRCTVLLDYRLISLDELLKLRNEDEMLSEEKKLRIRIMLTILDGDVIASGHGLGPKLGKLFNNPQYSDVTFRCGQQEIKAHKNILACQSKLFDAMFSADMMESTSGVVQVNDMCFSTLSLILRYVYTNQVTEFHPDMTLEVIYGAEKYMLRELKHLCFAKLVACITDDNVGALAVAAHLYGAQPEVLYAIRDYVDEDFVNRARTNPELWKLVEQYPEAFMSD